MNFYAKAHIAGIRGIEPRHIEVWRHQPQAHRKGTQSFTRLRALFTICASHLKRTLYSLFRKIALSSHCSHAKTARISRCRGKARYTPISSERFFGTSPVFSNWAANIKAALRLVIMQAAGTCFSHAPCGMFFPLLRILPFAVLDGLTSLLFRILVSV